ncbi:Acetylornithine/succinyldiaminopimelate/putrescine aminotransferase (ArgD) (PDB:2E54) [Commensalibacter communis]|uniref:Acetylornithine aminotransferase n=1 Tax=Commensalibacter communis TaxID=2972786 RepID=A0A9W4TLZ6_9PROT|nr:aspartate aminotransferase family protein [Commensalibacter communis]CAI3925907.1 Acetylornithine/succinyldiaminopimelate/putrescine aminotransferase (ArgD) (PDB:2E54) [Commensalibacter communis]CAI3927329.1 Acetylornithine/succinyldiaminopimelate/putrescine aminotransferase (ArgD) (PDB:2E54) [Commensalibacter communis]CAI3927413.1 Acetylornithine/succinyldiaminopimelate/putrescine aminotransferase (ArgD) (PDB:2E54) [Commensalibacter communis]CAI3935075.1 Acetylornithine/succinyldiaminopimel
MISVLMPTYNRANLAFMQGQGAWLFTEDKRRFLDFGAGIATSSIGHNHPHLTNTIAEQAKLVLHVSNLYRIPQAEKLAQRLVEISFADSVFFCNSGAEANEGIIKGIRRAQFQNGHPERTDIICFKNAFHGRTLATLTATGNPKYLEGFEPRLPGIKHIPVGDLEALHKAVDEHTAGFLIEPIQGESGINVVPEVFLRELRKICDEKNLYLGFDEIQCGMGRTGKMFAYQWTDVEPDIMSLAKGIAGGVPMGAFLAKESIAKHLTPGTHGSTFGGNPLACAAGNAVLDILLSPNFLDQVVQTGDYLRNELQTLIAQYPTVFEEVKGMGLMLGLKGKLPPAEIQNAALHQDLLTVAAGNNVLRIIPPLIITEEECHEGANRLAKAAKQLQNIMEQN